MPTIPPGGYGTQLATGGEDTLFSTTTPGTYVLTIDLANLAGGDTVVIRAYLPATSGGTKRMLLGGSGATFSGAQTAPNILQTTMMVVAPYGCDFRIIQTAGVNRNYAWRVDQMGTVTVEAAGTITTTTSEQTIGSDITTNRTLVLLTDHADQAASEQVTLRAKTCALSGGTMQTVYETSPTAGVLVAPEIMQQSVPIPCSYQGRFTVQRIASGDMDIPYVICSLQDA